MATRYVLTDEMWAELEPLLACRAPRRGGRWREYREVVEAIIWPGSCHLTEIRGFRQTFVLVGGLSPA